MKRTVVAILATVLSLPSVALIGRTVICEHEDSARCVWVGPWQGNGEGRVVVNW